jgi:hypothetical protein
MESSACLLFHWEKEWLFLDEMGIADQTIGHTLIVNFLIEST